jgi:hypothetical protein
MRMFAILLSAALIAPRVTERAALDPQSSQRSST